MLLDCNMKSEIDPGLFGNPISNNQIVRKMPKLFIPAALDQRGSPRPMRNLYPTSRDHFDSADRVQRMESMLNQCPYFRPPTPKSTKLPLRQLYPYFPQLLAE